MYVYQIKALFMKHSKLLEQTRSNWFKLARYCFKFLKLWISKFFSWKFLLEIFKISNLYTLKIIEVYSIAPPCGPFKVKKNFAQKWIAWNDLRTFNLETPLGNITWKWLDQKHICNLLHIYGLCKIKCICNLRYIFNHSWKWHEYVCLSLYIKKRTWPWKSHI